MNEILVKAFEIIFGVKPDRDIAEWQVAQMVLDNFNGPKLGEVLAKRCLAQIVGYIYYPNNIITKMIVGHAENLATELWDELPAEPHMDQIIYLENTAYSSHK